MYIDLYTVFVEILLKKSALSTILVIYVFVTFAKIVVFSSRFLTKHYGKTTGAIFMKFGGKVYLRLRRNPLHFEADPNIGALLFTLVNNARKVVCAAFMWCRNNWENEFLSSRKITSTLVQVGTKNYTKTDMKM